MKKYEDGFTLIDLLVSLAIIGIVAMIAVPQFVMTFDRARQRRSMADMRNLSTALSTYQLDNGGTYPTTSDGLAGLKPEYYAAIPDDGWGNSYLYLAVSSGGRGCGYLLYGLGADSVLGPAAPDPWIGDFFEPDVKLVNGTFHAAPGRPDESAQIGASLAAGCS